MATSYIAVEGKQASALVHHMEEGLVSIAINGWSFSEQGDHYASEAVHVRMTIEQAHEILAQISAGLENPTE